MDDESAKQIDERYAGEKQHGVKFFPDIVYKDMLVAFGVFLLLISLATSGGEGRTAGGSERCLLHSAPRVVLPVPVPDAQVLPRPAGMDWHDDRSGSRLAVAASAALHRSSPYRHWRNRKIAIGIMSVAVMGIVGLTLLAVAETPPQEEVGALTSISEQVVAGRIYASRVLRRVPWR